MNILFLTIARITDISQRGIYTDLVRDLMKNGHKVFIATPTERRFHESEKVIESYGAKILLIKTLNIQKTNVIEKGIGTLLLEPQFKKSIKKYWSDVNFDLVIYSTPPITFNKVIEWQKSKGARTYLMLKDIFPQNAVDLGMLKKGSFLWRIFRNKEERLYEISDRIGCMSPANCEFVIKNNPSLNPNKVELCPNSVELVPNQPKLSSFEKKEILNKYGFKLDVPLFIYGGNLGKPQGIDYLIKVLDRIKDRNDLQFCIVGSGTESLKLHSWKEQNKPENIKVMEVLPKDDYDKLVASADVGMIFLDPRFTIPNFPSRLLSYLENRIPVLLATDTNTDMGRIAEANGFGLWKKTDDINGIVENINLFASNQDLCHRMGEKGFQYLLENYTIDKSTNIILESK